MKKTYEAPNAEWNSFHSDTEIMLGPTGSMGTEDFDWETEPE